MLHISPLDGVLTLFFKVYKVALNHLLAHGTQTKIMLLITEPPGKHRQGLKVTETQRSV